MTVNQFTYLTKVEDWKIRQSVVFDWHDGPRHGICELANPICEFVFDLLAERFNPNGLDEKLFKLRELPSGTVRQVISMLGPLGAASSPVWVPTWQFSTEAERESINAAIDEIIGSARQTNLVVFTQDMENFLRIWNVDATSHGGIDWFTHLGIPPHTG